MMKKVIFLGLLSLSMCLSKPAEDKVAPTPAAATPAAAAAVTNVSSVESKTVNASTPHVETQTVNKNVTESKQNSTQVSEPSKISEPTPQPKENTTKPVDNKTTEKELPPAKEVPKNSTETKVATEKAITDKPKNETDKIITTTKPGMSNTTEAPKSEDKHVLQARGFDGPSFIGGMILTLGLLAIGFMGFKYYKNQTERNYHTL